MESPISLNQATLSTTTPTPKSIFASKTFWAAAFTALAAIAPIVGTAVKEHKLTVDETVNIVLIVCGAATTVTGRVQAKDLLYTPSWAPGPNKSDLKSAQSE